MSIQCILLIINCFSVLCSAFLVPIKTSLQAIKPSVVVPIKTRGPQEVVTELVKDLDSSPSIQATSRNIFLKQIGSIAKNAKQIGSIAKNAHQESLANLGKVSRVMVNTKDLVSVLVPQKEVLGDTLHPIRQLGKEMQALNFASSVDGILENTLKWIPENIKPPIRSVFLDLLHYAFNAICRGKAHKNTHIQDLAKIAQEHIARISGLSMAVAMNGMDVMCASKTV